MWHVIMEVLFPLQHNFPCLADILQTAIISAFVRETGKHSYLSPSDSNQLSKSNKYTKGRCINESVPNESVYINSSFVSFIPFDKSKFCCRQELNAMKILNLQ